MYEQRPPLSERRLRPTEQFWAPQVQTESGPADFPECLRAFGEHDFYVVIDDLAYGGVVFEVNTWPRLDEEGRLVFEDEGRTRFAALETAQRIIDEARRGRDQLERPLRIGDVFYVCFSESQLPEHIEEWRIEADVTRAAREAAKMAFYSAVAPRLDREEEQALAPLVEERPRAEEEPGAEGPLGPGAFPAL